MTTPGFIFGKGTPWTYEELQRKREIANALASQIGTPRNVGEGLTAIGKALASRGINRRADKRDAELKGEFEGQWDALFGGAPMGGGMVGGTASPSPANPNAPQAIADDTMAALGKEPLTPVGWNSIRNGIFAGESGGDYNALFGFSNRDGGKFAGTNLTNMTVDQALAFANPNGPYAQHVKGQVGRVATPMGAYQVVGTTLNAAKQGLGLTGNEQMTPELQDRIGQWIYKTQGTGAWAGYRGPQSGGGGGTPSINPLDIGTLAELAGNPYATPGQKAVVQALMQQQMQNMDPMRQMEMERAQLELDALRNPKADVPDAVRSREMLAQRAGLQPGTPEYQTYMATGELPKPSATTRIVSGDEAKALGLDPSKSYNITQGPNGIEAAAVGGGGTTINNNMGGGKFDEEFAKGDAQTLVTVSDAGNAAIRNLGRLDQIEDLLSKSPSGMGAALAQKAGEWGINTEGLSEIQSAQALINSMVPEQRQPGSGPMSDRDVALFKETLPRMINQPGGNQMILNALRGIAQYDAAGAEIVQRLRRGEIDRGTAFEMLQARENPLASFAAGSSVAPAGGSAGEGKKRLKFNPETGDLE